MLNQSLDKPQAREASGPGPHGCTELDIITLYKKRDNVTEDITFNGHKLLTKMCIYGALRPHMIMKA